MATELATRGLRRSILPRCRRRRRRTLPPGTRARSQVSVLLATAPPLVVYKNLVSDIEAVFTVEELERKAATTNVEQVRV